MSSETILYKNGGFDLNNQVISWLQKFMELYLSTLNHPRWFNEVLEDLRGNFHVPHGKYFFDENIIGSNSERLNYCINMIDLVIIKLESISKKDFFLFINAEIKDSWCDISNKEFYNEQWFNDDENFKLLYIGSLRKLKELMLQDIECR